MDVFGARLGNGRSWRSPSVPPMAASSRTPDLRGRAL